MFFLWKNLRVRSYLKTIGVAKGGGGGGVCGPVSPDPSIEMPPMTKI